MRGIRGGLLLLVAVPALAAACGGGGSSGSSGGGGGGGQTVVETKDTSQGAVLVDGSGQVLYTFSKGVDCTGKCADVWQPLAADGDLVGKSGIDSSSLGTAKRADGTMQVTYKGDPLYVYSASPTSLDYEVQSFGGAWKLIHTGKNPLAPQKSGTTSCEPNCGY